MKKSLTKILSLALLASAVVPVAGANAKVWNDDYGEWVFDVVHDFNGGATTEDGQGTLTLHSVGVVPSLSAEGLISCVDYDSEHDLCHPLKVAEGKELDYVTVNGVRHDLGEGDGYELNQDTTIVYYWRDAGTEDYTVADTEGNSVSFDGEEGHEYTFNAYRFSFSMSDADLETMGITKEEYEEGKAMVIGAVGDQGTVIAYYEFEVYDEDDNYIEEGPFTVRIKLTDDMAGYDVYKLVSIEFDDEGNATAGEPIILTVEDGYLVGTVPHFSGYALVGDMSVDSGDEEAVKAPDTGIFTAGSGMQMDGLIPMAVAVALLAVFGLIKVRSHREE